TRFSRDWSSDVCSSDLEKTLKRTGSFHISFGVCFAAYYRIGGSMKIRLTPIAAAAGFAVSMLMSSGALAADTIKIAVAGPFTGRSEERRVGKECRSGGC